jgi:GGDEF domain-containing protein
MRHGGSTHLISTLPPPIERDHIDMADLYRAASDCYVFALRSVSQYAVQIEPHQIAEFRLHLKGIEHQWNEAQGSDGLHAVQASFRGELREYRDRTREQLARLRKELEGAAAAMASFANGIAAHGADHEEDLKNQFKRLQLVSASNDIQEIRGGIRAALGEIAVSLDQVRRGNQLIVAQLQDEIRVLHQEFQAERRALFTDPASGAWTRAKVDMKIHELLRQGDRFCVIAVAFRNLSQVNRDYSRTLVEVTLKALLMRFRGTLGDDTMIGRWNEHEFIAILDMDPDALAGIAEELHRKLAGPYSAQENGLAYHVVLELTAGALAYPGRSDQRGSDQRGSDQRGSDQRGSDQRGSDQRGSDQRGSDSATFMRELDEKMASLLANSSADLASTEDLRSLRSASSDPGSPDSNSPPDCGRDNTPGAGVQAAASAPDRAHRYGPKRL